MKIKNPMLGLVTEFDHEIINSILNQKNSDFSKIRDLLDLDPRSDFRYANLQGVDFSGADLRHHDFTGADLTDTIGINVVFDETTILDDADTAESIFSHYVDEMELFGRLDSADRKYNFLKNAEWSSLSAWLDILLNGGNTSGMPAPVRHLDATDTRTLAKKLISDNIGGVKRSSIMYNSAQLFENKGDFRSFLLNCMARNFENTELIKSTLRAAMNLYPSDPGIMRVAILLSDDDRLSIKELCLRFIVNNDSEEICKEVLFRPFFDRKNLMFRKFLIISSAARLGENHVRAVCADESVDHSKNSNVLDWLLDVREDEMRAQLTWHARRNAISKAMDRSKLLADESLDLDSVVIGKNDLENSKKTIRTYFDEILLNDPILRSVFRQKDPERFKNAVHSWELHKKRLANIEKEKQRQSYARSRI